MYFFVIVCFWHIYIKVIFLLNMFFVHNNKLANFVESLIICFWHQVHNKTKIKYYFLSLLFLSYFFKKKITLVPKICRLFVISFYQIFFKQTNTK